MTQAELAADVARRLGVVAHPAVTQIAEAVALFAPLGWAMCDRWHQAGTVRVLRLAAKGAEPTVIDEAIAEVWNSDNQVLLRHAAAPIRRWSNSHYPFKQVLWDRVTLIEKAIQHHLAGAYEASIPTSLSSGKIASAAGGTTQSPQARRSAMRLGRRPAPKGGTPISGDGTRPTRPPGRRGRRRRGGDRTMTFRGRLTGSATPSSDDVTDETYR